MLFFTIIAYHNEHQQFDVIFAAPLLRHFMLHTLFYIIMKELFIDFRPAEIAGGKETYVCYYVLDPCTNKLHRMRIRLNHIKPKKERLQYARLLCLKINQKLYAGWNPLIGASGNSHIKMSLSEASTAYLCQKKNKLRKEAFRAYKGYVSFFVKWCKSHHMSSWQCEYFTEKHAKSILNDLETKQIRSSTYNGYLDFFKILFGSFVKDGIISNNPFKMFTPQKREEKLRTIIPKEDRKKILNYCRRLGMREYITIMKLCYKYFIRPKEILMLKIRDVNFKDGVLVIPAEVSKNHRPRTIALSSDILNYMKSVSDANPEYYIFSDAYRPGSHLRHIRTIERTWNKIRNALQMPESFKFYSLKDTGITEMLEKGVPAKYVQELAGHQSLSMTEKYIHRSDAKKILQLNTLTF